MSNYVLIWYELRWKEILIESKELSKLLLEELKSGNSSEII